MTVGGSSLDLDRLPRHVAIIMDGNGRWAKKRKRPRLYGHKVGADSVSDIVRVCRELGIASNNCYVILHRARHQLRACLEKTWFGQGE